MKEIPLVSIVLLTYNHEKYIENCLQSILEQNYENIEIIILDDASKDKTVIVIESYLSILKQKFNNVFFIKNEENKGNIPSNMNCMLRRTKGLYCKMLSGDDILQYNCISKLVECLLKNPQCSVVYSNVYMVDDSYKKGDWIEKTKNLYSYRKSEVESKELFRKLMFGNHIAAPSVMIKKEVLTKYGFLDETIPYEDYEYWLRLSFHNVKFYFLNECLVYYRRSDTSLSNFDKGAKNKKIRIGMISDKRMYNKYLRYLTKDDRVKCEQFYYNRYLRICWEGKYWRGFFALLYSLKKNNGNISLKYLMKPTFSEYKNISERNIMVIKMLEKWIYNSQNGINIVNYFREKNFKFVAIYGLGCIANCLCSELKNTEIEVKYIIDRNADRLLSDIKLVAENESLEAVDVIVVIPAGQFYKIKEQLEKKVTCPIIYIGDILFS